THAWVVRYGYDSQDRVQKLTLVDGNEMQSSELRYESDGRVSGMSTFTGSQHDETWSLRYLDDGKLDEITDTHNRTIFLAYDANDMISDVRVIDGSTTDSYRYSYEDGTVTGLTFAPDIPVASQFDLKGKSYDDLALMHIAPPIMTDVPHVGG